MRRVIRKGFRHWREHLRPRPTLSGVTPETHVLLLDVDGVLITPDDFYGAKLFREHPDLMRDFMGTSFHSASTGRSDLLEHLPALMAAMGRTGDPGNFYREWLEYENRPNAPMLDAVRELRSAGWRAYLATNQEAHRTRHLLQESGLQGITDGHFASYTVGHRKPTPEYYAEVTRQLSLPPEHLVFWDDAAENVQAAREAGWTAHLFTGVADFRRVMGL